MHLAKWILYVEVDEHRHAYYDSTCEAARLDVVQFGSQVNKPSLLVRFNPHLVKGECEVPFEDRLRTLAQYLWSVLKSFEEKIVAEDPMPVMTILHLFYGSESASKNLVETHATNMLIFLPDINSSYDVRDLDDNIRALSLADVCEVEVTAKLLSNALQAMQDHIAVNQCAALSNFNTPKQHRCSAVSQKDSDLCHRQNQIVKRGRQVHRFV